MKWTEFTRDYLSFTSKERIAVIALLCMILVIAILPRVIDGLPSGQSTPTDTSWISAMKRSRDERLPNTRFATDDGQQEPGKSGPDAGQGAFVGEIEPDHFS